MADFCRARERDAGDTLICIAEGAREQGGDFRVRARIADSPDPIRLGGAGLALQHHLERLLGSEVRSALLGHVQRGGAPTPYDRVLATRFGYHAAELLRTGRYGRMVALQGDVVTSVPIADVAGRSRTVPVDDALVKTAQGIGVMLGQRR